MAQYEGLADELRSGYWKPSDYERWYNYQMQIYHQQAYYQQYQYFGQRGPSPIKK